MVIDIAPAEHGVAVDVVLDILGRLAEAHDDVRVNVPLANLMVDHKRAALATISRRQFESIMEESHDGPRYAYAVAAAEQHETVSVYVFPAAMVRPEDLTALACYEGEGKTE